MGYSWNLLSPFSVPCMVLYNGGGEKRPSFNFAPASCASRRGWGALMMLAVMLFTTSFLGGRMATFGGAHRSAGRELRASATTDAPAAFLTREDGKNGKLEALLASRGIKCAELPCIAFERLAGFDELQVALKTGGHGWVVITSPEAAGVFVEAWRAAGEPPRPPLAVRASARTTLEQLAFVARARARVAACASCVCVVPWVSERAVAA